MSEFKVIKNQPIPRQEAGSPKYPFHKMDIGDCFYVQTSKDFTKAKCAASFHGKKYGKKFLSRQTDGKFGIWRVE